MKENEIQERLKQIKIEDYIWVIYLGIIFLSWYSNKVERDYFITNNKKSKEEYRKIMILIFSILNIAYFYFLLESIKGVNNTKITDSYNAKKLNSLSLIASLLISISGILLLYIAISDEDMNVEIAFN